MKKTNYELQEEKSGYLTVLKDGKCEAKGFNDEESALHAIWVIEGRDLRYWFKREGAEVYQCEVEENE